MKRMIFRLQVVFLALLASGTIAAGTSNAATYYVSPSGNNTADGSQSRPWASLSYACSRVKTAGDTISLAAGTYDDSSQCLLAPGVNIAGAGASQTIIRSSYTDWYIRADSNPIVEGGQKISGFTLDGNNRTLAHGISVTGRHHATIDGVDFIHIRDKAIRLQGVDYWPNNDGGTYPPVPPPGYSLGCVVRNVRITGCSEAIPMSAMWVQSVEQALFENIVIDESATSGGRGNAFKSWPGWMKQCVIRNCTFTVNPSSSMDAIPLEIFNVEKDTEIYNNTFNEGYISLVQGRQNGGTWALKFHDNRLINTVPLGYAHEIALGNIDFYNNSITVQSLGIWSSKYALSQIRLRNNVIYNTKGQGIVVTNVGPSNLDSVEIYNNVIDTTNQGGPGAGILLNTNNVSVTNLKIRNNLFQNLGVGVSLAGTASSISSPVITHNAFYGVGTTIQNNGAPSPVFNSNLTVNPQLNATGTRPSPYYRLRSTSPLINAGVNLGFPFSGSAPDIGAYELAPALSPPQGLAVTVAP